MKGSSTHHQALLGGMSSLSEPSRERGQEISVSRALIVKAVNDLEQIRYNEIRDRRFALLQTMPDQW